LYRQINTNELSKPILFTETDLPLLEWGGKTLGFLFLLELL